MRRGGAPLPGGRILGLDSLRGLCVWFMVLYHFFYDLVYFFGFAPWIAENPFAVFCQLASSCGFIFTAGVSSRLSADNIRRGGRVLAAGLLVTGVSLLWGAPVWFGILQFLGCAMVIYGLTRKFWERIPRTCAPILYLGCFFLTQWLLDRTFPVSFLFPLGFISSRFVSYDYYPIFPYLFLFLLGTWAGNDAEKRRLPGWFLSWKLPVASFLGRHSLVAYLLHQPILIALCYALAFLTGHPLR